MPENADISPDDLAIPADERWWEDPSLDREQLLSGLAKYALARDSRYDRLEADTGRISKSLGTAVRELRVFTSSAAKRDEVYTRKEVRKMRRRTIATVLLTVLGATLASAVFTLGVVVPKCFFGGIPHGRACHAIPGYTKSEDQQLERVNRLQNGVSQVPENQARIEELERRVGQLEQKR